MSPSLVLCERKNSIAANFSMRVKAKISRMRNRSQQKKGCRLLIFRIVFYPGFQAHLTPYPNQALDQLLVPTPTEETVLTSSIQVVGLIRFGAHLTRTVAAAVVRRTPISLPN